MAKKYIHPLTKLQQELEATRKKLGEPVESFLKKKNEVWHPRIATLPPRHMAYVFDWRADKMVLSHGFDNLGYDSEQTFTNNELMNMYHENQRIIVAYYVAKIHQLMPTFRNHVDRKNFCLGSLRSRKAKDGTYWLTYITSEPYQFDANGNIVSYFSWEHILSEYRGEPITNDAFHKEGEHEKEVKKLQNKLDEFIEDTIRYLGFTKLQVDTLLRIATGYTTPEIVSQDMITEGRILDRYREITKAAKNIFPKNSFESIRGVVEYMQKQGILYNGNIKV